jgi:hypothetical protein
MHRFNLAFDRGLIADRIVDLVIAAEALFLGDLDVKVLRFFRAQARAGICSLASPEKCGRYNPNKKDALHVGQAPSPIQVNVAR